MAGTFKKFESISKVHRSVDFDRIEVENNSITGNFYVTIRGGRGWDESDNQQVFTPEEFDAFIRHCIWVRDGGDEL